MEATEATEIVAQVQSALMGLCVGDALGVPVEFSSRAARQQDPVRDLRGYGTWNQPPGTWSDDSSLTFCLADCLVDALTAGSGAVPPEAPGDFPADADGFSLAAIARSFCRWLDEGWWAARGTAFDVGGATARAIGKLQVGESPETSGGRSERSNGNGALMRILPIAFCFAVWPEPVWRERVDRVAAITHAHPRSRLACGLYARLAADLVAGASPVEAYGRLPAIAASYGSDRAFAEELPHFSRILDGSLPDLPESTIGSSGYVLDALEAALWCWLGSASYPETVLKAVNLGDDTDTTAAIAGGLAGLTYGLAGIPEDWQAAIARREDVLDLGARLGKAVAAARRR